MRALPFACPCIPGSTEANAARVCDATSASAVGGFWITTRPPACRYIHRLCCVPVSQVFHAVNAVTDRSSPVCLHRSYVDGILRRHLGPITHTLIKQLAHARQHVPTMCGVTSTLNMYVRHPCLQATDNVPSSSTAMASSGAAGDSPARRAALEGLAEWCTLRSTSMDNIEYVQDFEELLSLRCTMQVCMAHRLPELLARASAAGNSSEQQRLVVLPAAVMAAAAEWRKQTPGAQQGADSLVSPRAKQLQRLLLHECPLSGDPGAQEVFREVSIDLWRQNTGPLAGAWRLRLPTTWRIVDGQPQKPVKQRRQHIRGAAAREVLKQHVLRKQEELWARGQRAGRRQKPGAATITVVSAGMHLMS